MRSVVVIGLLGIILSGCDAGKTYQEACFQPAPGQADTQAGASLNPFAIPSAPKFDPVLTVQPTEDANYVHCS